jgi:ankyrin repeat protein
MRTRCSVVRGLIASGADVNARDDRDRLPLRFAVSRGYADIAEFLRAHGATEE